MAVARPIHRRLILLALGLALPALGLAALATFLTFRIVRAVESEGARYTTYLSQQVAEAFEQELMAHLRAGIGTVEALARNGVPRERLLEELDRQSDEFEGGHFVPLNELNGYSLLMVESQPMLFTSGAGPHQGESFAGLLLRGEQDEIIGAGGWWIDPGTFLATHLEAVVQDRLPGNPRMYGGIESRRRVSIQIFSPANGEIARVREPAPGTTARATDMEGPFEGFRVRVSPTSSATVIWTGRFVALQVGFIALLALGMFAAAAFAVRYTVRQLELAQLKAGFVSNVTHELKTPIALIRLAVETLELGRYRTPQEAERFIHAIGRETIRLSQLVDNILDFARLEAGQRVFKFEPVDLLQVVRDALESFRPRLDHLGFTVEEILPGELTPVSGDPTALSHCVLNLLDNAVKYSRERKHITIAAGTRDQRVWVSVSDRGIGIANEDRERIFEKFVRLETGLVHDVKGAGLGLSLVAQIMRAHNGRVDVRSEPGEGSTFTLELPASGGMVSARTEDRQKTAS
jgi:signal transduction histidine kinase